MSHSVRKAIDKHKLRDLSQIRTAPWLIDTFLDWSAIAVSLYSVYLMPNIVIVFVSIIVIGNRQHGLTILGHDGAHFRTHKNRKMNDFLTNILCFWPIGLTSSGYRKLHNKHHQDVGTEKDPELAHKKSRSPQWDLPASPFKILRYAVLDLLGLSIVDYKIIVTYSKPDKLKQYIPLFLWHITSIIIFVCVGFWWVPLLWYLSLFTSFMMFFRLRLWLEHQGTTETHRLHLNPLEAAILSPHNAWLHWEHHNWPSIPYYNLPKVRKITQATPIIKLNNLLSFFKSASPMHSGEPLKKN